MMASATELSRDLAANLRVLRTALGESMDVIVREFTLGPIPVALVCIDGLLDKPSVQENVLRAIMVDTHLIDAAGAGARNLVSLVKERILSVGEVKEIRDTVAVIDGVLNAHAAILFDQNDSGLLVNLPGFKMRSIEEPKTEPVVRGPREGFVESLRVNLSLLRRKVKSPELRLQHHRVGRVTRTDVCVAYIEGLADPEVVDEVRRRLGRIDIDGILESGYIEQIIEDAPQSLFPTVGNTEKPDRLAAQLLEGRVGILTDGTPTTLTVPYLFVETLQSSEDYYIRHIPSSFFRILRTFALLLTMLLPALYVATSSFNPEMLPTALLITMAASREGIPIPAVGEILVLGIFYEVLREAGLRLPRPVGEAVSIAGAIVIGQAAVQAGLVSTPAIIVTALTGIASFVIPSQADAWILVRLFIVSLTAVAGFFGLFTALTLILAHLASLRSFGVPYLTPLAPLKTEGLKDTFVRASWRAMDRRPPFLARRDNLGRSGPSTSSPPGEKNPVPGDRPEGGGG
jgi:spore germination protein KA